MEESAKFSWTAQRFVLETLDGGLQGDTFLYFFFLYLFEFQCSEIFLYLCDYKLLSEKTTQGFLMIVYLQLSPRH